jgi:hypothetical protein
MTAHSVPVVHPSGKAPEHGRFHGLADFLTKSIDVIAVLEDLAIERSPNSPKSRRSEGASRQPHGPSRSGSGARWRRRLPFLANKTFIIEQ